MAESVWIRRKGEVNGGAGKPHGSGHERTERTARWRERVQRSEL